MFRMNTDAWDLGVVDELDWIRSARVLRDGSVAEIDVVVRLVINDVFYRFLIG